MELCDPVTFSLPGHRYRMFVHKITLNTLWLSHISIENVFLALCYAKFIQGEFAAVHSEIPHSQVLFERPEASGNNRGFKSIF